jgi:hypothetical protein
VNESVDGYLEFVMRKAREQDKYSSLIAAKEEIITTHLQDGMLKI